MNIEPGAPERSQGKRCPKILISKKGTFLNSEFPSGCVQPAAFTHHADHSSVSRVGQHLTLERVYDAARSTSFFLKEFPDCEIEEAFSS